MPPVTPNGAILIYFVERSLTAELGFTVIANISGSSQLSYTDTGLVPFRVYHYRVVAVNSVGNATSPSANATTTEAGEFFKAFHKPKSCSLLHQLLMVWWLQF